MSEDGYPIFADYRLPKRLQPNRQKPNEGPTITWDMLIDNWGLIEVDLLETFGADINSPHDAHPWPWWRDLILGLLDTDTRIRRALTE